VHWLQGLHQDHLGLIELFVNQLAPDKELGVKRHSVFGVPGAIAHARSNTLKMLCYSKLPQLLYFHRQQSEQLSAYMEFAMIRFTTPNDKNGLMALAEASGLFEPDQTEELAEMLNQHFSEASASQDLWFTDEDSGIVGVGYVAPERMTEGTWNLYLIAIHPNYQRQGRGAALIRHIEQVLTDRGERILLVETSGLDDFEYVRSFYRKSGYHEEARIREFYKSGDDKIIFRKALGSGTV
jgi:ribosomal protein S18 acetylase RimI-like enzyme